MSFVVRVYVCCWPVLLLFLLLSVAAHETARLIHSLLLSSPLLLALSFRYAGCVAGIIGLTSLNGFALYVATHLIVSLVLVLKVQPRCNPLSLSHCCLV